MMQVPDGDVQQGGNISLWDIHGEHRAYRPDPDVCNLPDLLYPVGWAMVALQIVQHGFVIGLLVVQHFGMDEILTPRHVAINPCQWRTRVKT